MGIKIAWTNHFATKKTIEYKLLRYVTKLQNYIVVFNQFNVILSIQYFDIFLFYVNVENVIVSRY